jgi:hypothetical protein
MEAVKAEDEAASHKRKGSPTLKNPLRNDCGPSRQADVCPQRANVAVLT